MHKNIAAGVVEIEYTVDNYKGKQQLNITSNRFLKDGKYDVLEGGICAAGDIIVCGPDYESAAEYLKPFLIKCTDVEDHVEQLKLTEELYDVQVWDTTDFNLGKVLGEE